MKGVEQIEHTFHNLASPKRGHTFWGLVVVLIATSFFLWTKHGSWMHAPNDVMLSDSPDAFKNYMAAAWHVQRDSSYVHFSGMGYPYGEHILFTDSQPIVGAAIQWWSRQVKDLSKNVFGIINWFQLLSVVFGSGVLYLLLRKLHLPVWYAGMAALGIAFLSPQGLYFDQHFSLSHIWVLPMLLLLLCRYEERQSRRYQSLLIGILIWFSAQLHISNLAVSSLFLGFYTFFQILIDRSWRNIWTRMSHLIGMVLLPFAVLNVWIHWSDYCPDRPLHPYGFIEYLGHWESVFLPYDFLSMHQWIDQHVLHMHKLEDGAPMYVGWVATIFTLWLVLKRRFRLFEPSWEAAAYHRVHKNYLRGICFAAFAMLLFGLGFPFAINGLENVIAYLGPFKQFRDLGRFTWPFYYAIHVLLFYILWNKSQRPQVPEKWMSAIQSRSEKIAQYLPSVLRWTVPLVPLAVLCSQAFQVQKHDWPHPVPNLTLQNAATNNVHPWLKKVDFARFQALMPLPYYHIGSENFWLEINNPLFKKVQYTALNTGLADMGVNMSRTALSRTLKSVQFALLPCEPPSLLYELPDIRPIAIMIEPGQWEETQKKYPHLLSKATTVYNGPELRILSLIPDSVRTWTEQNARKIATEIDRNATYNAGPNWQSNKPPGWYAYLSFDSIATSQYAFKGKGAAEGNQGDTTKVWNKQIPKGNYTCSFWVKVDEDMAIRQELNVIETNAQNTPSIVHRQVAALQTGIQTIVQGWALIEYPFEVEKDGSNVEIYLYKKQSDLPFWYDEVLIKSNDLTFYRKTPGWAVRNNFWYKLPKD